MQRCSKGSECRDTPKVLAVRCSGAAIPQEFCMWKCHKGAGYSDTPNVWVQRCSRVTERPQKLWVQRCPRNPGCMYTPKVLHVEVLQRSWM